jgi:hypothetical protein
MDVFDVATALTGDERELWTVDDAGGLGPASDPWSLRLCGCDPWSLRLCGLS